MLHFDLLQPQQVVLLTLDHPQHHVNIIGPALGEALAQALVRLRQLPALRGVIFTSAKATFLAGGDLDYLHAQRDAATVFEAAQQLKTLFRAFETLGVPVVAALNGSALGGGLELALSCHYRIAIEQEAARFGLPEVNLGLLPGAGGVVRTMWMFGLETAFRILTEGKQFTVSESLSMGWIDAMAPHQQAMIEQALNWIDTHPNPKKPWDNKGKIPGGTPRQPHMAQMVAAATAMLTQKTHNNYPAAQAILNTLAEGAVVDFDTACRIESRYFANLVVSPTAKSMIRTLWFGLNNIKAGASRPANEPTSRVQRVGIIGAGMMGSGIAYAAATAGVDVILKDVSIEAANRGKAHSQQLLHKRVQQGKMNDQQVTTVLDRIQPTTNASDFENCDLVIEAVFENRDLKAQVTREAVAHLPASAFFASNTSTLPISSLAEAHPRPEQFIGLHFFSPVHKMQLVEIIVGQHTSPTTLARAFDFVKQINKTPIVVRDSRGFYTSRVFATYIMEGMAMLLEGVHPAAIERAGIRAGMPVGPLALTDEVSLSLALDIEQQTARDLGTAYRANPGTEALRRMVIEHFRYGRAKGGGFYEYPAHQDKYLWPQLSSVFPVAPAAEQPPAGELQERLLFVQALETVRCLDEKIVQSVDDANVGSILGWGFAPCYGGTLQYINHYGRQQFIQRAQQLHTRFGTRFARAGHFTTANF